MRPNTNWRYTAVAIVGVAAISVAGCNWNQPAPDASAPGSTPRDVTPATGDQQVITEVQAKFYGDDLIRGRQIDVAADNGVVTLRGTVPDEEAKERALALTRSVGGVTSVNDQLQVRDAVTASAEHKDPPSTPGRVEDARDVDVDNDTLPAWITTKIQAQYFTDPEVSPWNIDVTTASGGIVTLEGTVDSEQDKAEAVRIARETEGVTRVEDRLRVVPDSERTDSTPAAGEPGGESPDAWLTTKIAAKYFLDDDVKGRLIDIDTQMGVVTLKGRVADDAERRQAVALARNTDGVREVRDELQVDPALQERLSADKPQQTADADVKRPDGWITTKIQAQYFLDTEVKGRQINVDTANGVVTLKGTVETVEQRTAAEQIARETEGVTRVVNQLTVGSPSAQER